MENTSPPFGTDPNTLEEGIREYASKGKLNTDERWTLLWLYIERMDQKLECITDNRNSIKTIERDIDTLKKKNIIIWIEKHPKLVQSITMAYAISYALLIATHMDEIGPVIMQVIHELQKLI